MGSDISSIEKYAASVRRVLIVTLILNAAVALAKVVYGYVTNSVAMTSDGFHSFFDGVSNVVGLIGIWIAAHPPDAEHPYGHKKYETLFTIIIAVMIFATCFQILKKVYSSFVREVAVAVTEASFIIMFLTLCVNIFVMLYESKKGKQLGSDFLMADAMHTKSDIFVSLAVVVSLILTKAGYPRSDTIVGIIITFFIARIGYGILKDASRVLVDTTRLGTSEIGSVVNSIDGVKGCHDIRTRGSSSAVYLDLHVLVDRNLSIEKAHGIADSIEESIKKEFPAVVDIVVHVEPEPPENKT
jgi:cation diffusion facilitator family transporter